MVQDELVKEGLKYIWFHVECFEIPFIWNVLYHIHMLLSVPYCY